MRTINFRLLAIVLVGVVVLLGGIVLLHRVQTRRHADFYLEKAHAAKEDRNVGEALDLYERYLRLAPDDTEATAEYGLLLLEAGKWSRAYEKLEKVLRVDAERDDVRRRLAELAMAMGRYPDAAQQVKLLLDRNPKDPMLWGMQARCQVAAGNYESAKDSLSQAIRFAPDRVENYAALASVLQQIRPQAQRKDDQPTSEEMTSESVIKDMVEKNPKSSKAFALRASYYAEQATKANARGEDAAGYLKQAGNDIDEAGKLAPGSPEVQFFAAQVALAKKEMDTARKHARLAVELTAKDRRLQPLMIRAYLMVAEIERSTGAPEKAVAWLEEGRKRVKAMSDRENAELLASQAVIRVNQGNADEAETLVESLRKASESDPSAGSAQTLADYLQARIDCLRGQWLAGCRGLERVRTGLLQNRELLRETDYWLGRCYERLGNREEQLAAFRRAVATDPNWVPARVGLAASLAFVGRLQEAIEEQRRLMVLPGAPEGGWLLLAKWLIVWNSRLAPRQQAWPEVEALLDRAVKVSPDSAEVVLLRVEMLRLQGRVAEAEKLLQEARDKKPNQIAYWTALVSLAQRQRDWPKTERLLSELEQKLGDGLDVRLARARYLVDRYGLEAIPKLRELAQKADRLSGEELARLYGELAATLVQLGDHEEAQRLCRLVAEKQPDNLQIRLLQFEVAARSQDPAAMERVLQEIEKIEGKGPLWLVGEAVRLKTLATKREQNLLDQALAYLDIARKLRPKWSRVPLLAGEIHDLAGRTDLALENYQKAFEDEDRSPNIVRRMLEIFQQQQNYAAADKLIQQLGDQQSLLSPDLSRIAVDVSLQMEDFNRALTLARQVAANSKGFADQLWLGQVLRVVARNAAGSRRPDEAKALLAEAERSFRLANQLAPNEPGTWFGLIQILAQTGQTQAAEAALAEAKQKLPPAQAPLALAQCYEALGQPEEAAKLYQTALTQFPGNVALVHRVVEFYLKHGNAAEAEGLLRQIIDSKVESPKAEQADLVLAEQAWARRQLASLLAARGDRASRNQALELIEKNLSADPKSPVELRAKAMALAANPRRTSRLEAVRILETLLQDPGTATPEDRFILARLYARDRNWPRARDQWRTLLASQGKEPRYVAGYVNALLEQKETPEAEVWLRQLETMTPPGDFATARLRAEVLFQKGEYDGAITQIQGMAGKPDASASQKEALLMPSAAVAEEFARRLVEPARQADAAKFVQAAEAMIRQYVAQHKDQELVLAGFLARHERADQALEIAERKWKEAGQGEMAEFASYLAGTGTATPEQLKRLETLMQAALERHKRPIPLLLVMADLRTAQERFDDVEALYREILRRDEKHHITLNNLAVLLALRGKQLDEAQRLMEQAIDIAGLDPVLLDSRATVALALNKPQQALADLGEAILDEPKPTRYFHRAQVYLQMGNKAAASEDWGKAKDGALKPASLHPLERPAYNRMNDLLAAR